jgi:hypothetical protein
MLLAVAIGVAVFVLLLTFAPDPAAKLKREVAERQRRPRK